VIKLSTHIAFVQKCSCLLDCPTMVSVYSLHNSTNISRVSHLLNSVDLTPKVAYSIKMLSLLLERLSEAAFERISNRKELFSKSWRRRDKIVRSVASIPFLLRTILLVKSKEDREALLGTTLVKSAAFCKESGTSSASVK
jgi:hypothetical protein